MERGRWTCRFSGELVLIEDPYTVKIRHVSEGEITNFIKGSVEIRNKKIYFTAIAYGRVGGQNIFPILGRSAKKKLKELEIDIEEFELDLQRKLFAGEIDITAARLRED
ncbi:MAG: hypothetical protein IH932_04580 [Thaumarchaeota archaeon]|nr:hypothetical protein [Nitrososphaerota archaeon]